MPAKNRMKPMLLSILQKTAVRFLVFLLLTGCAADQLTPSLSDVENGCITNGWPHDASDLAPDPAITFGTLENGMRYVIMPNNEPRDRVGLYLDIQAGSLNEADSQRGYAHFLEHMLFNGTRHYPPGTLVKYFQSIGMSFGADTNAHTTFNETVYRILLPKGDRTSLENGLQVMADYARGALLLEDEVFRERGIILAEKRTRDSASYRLYEKRMRFSFAGTRVAKRLPIGTEEALANADSAMLKEYYDRWYRPENMILVVVGDADPELVRQLASHRFSELTAPDTKPRCFEYGKVDEQKTAALYVHEPEMGNTEVAIGSRWNTIPRVDSFAWQAELMRRYAAASLINNRLNVLVSREGSPLTSARMYSGTFLERFGYATLTGTAESGKWQEALQLLDTTLRQVLKSGFTRRELDRVRKEMLAELEKQVQTAGSRDSRELASQIIKKLNSNEVILSPRQDLGLFGPLVENLSLTEVNKVFSSLWSHRNRQYLVAGTADITSGEISPEDRILAVMTKAAKEQIPVWKNGNALSFPYLKPPIPDGAVTERENHEAIGAQTVLYQNGTVLNLKKTDFMPNELLLAVHFGKGRMDEPQPGMSMLADGVVRESGFGRLNREELQEALAGHPVDFNFGSGQESFFLNVKGLSRDLELMLQLVMTQLLDPAFREKAYILTRERFAQMYDRMQSSVDGMLELEGERFLAGGNPHFGFPPRERLMQIDLASIRQWLAPIFADAPLEVSLVGDMDEEKAVSLVGKYLGSLNRSEAEKQTPLAVSFPSGETLHRDVVTETDKSLVAVAWPTDDFWDISRTRRLNILAGLLEDRLRVVIREKLGEVYSPTVYNRSSRVASGYGVLRTVMTVDPKKAGMLADKVREVAAQLESGVQEEELHRSLEPTLTSIKDMMRTNRYWLNSVLSLSSRHPEQLGWPLTIQDDFASITTDDMRDFAGRYLQGRASAEIIFEPADR